jgi:hypothetical protein
MIHDPLVEEIHQVRQEILNRFNGDLHALCEDARARTEEASRSGRKVVSMPPRRPGPSKAKKKAS